MSTIASALLWSAAIQAATTGAQTWVSNEQAAKARSEQSAAQREAKAVQEKADADAERQRLEGIAANQTATSYSNIWGTDSAYANRYKDAAQKLSAGTGSFSDDDDTNPFYSKGLI